MWPFARAEEKERIEPRLVRAASPENPSTSLANPAQWLIDGLSGGPTFAGVPVNEHSSVRSTAVFRCVSLLSGIFGCLPLMVYERTESGRRIATEHRLYRLLHDAPNDLMSAYIWRELMGPHILLWGNHYSIIEYDGAARVVSFLPSEPWRVTVDRIGRRNRYTFQFDDGREVLDQDDVIHVPGIGFDGVKGLSRIGAVGKQAVGISLAMEEFTGRVHANGARPSGVVELAANLKPEGLQRLRAEFERAYSGLSNAGRTIFLDNGMKWSAMQLSPEDAQTIEARRFQVADICRIFGVPPHMVGETDKATSWGTGIEQQTLAFLMFSVDQDLHRIEGELNRKLFLPPFYCEFNRDALLAMDAKSRAEMFASGIQNGYFEPNFVREKFNLPRVEGGDRLFINSTLIPMEMAGKQQQGATDAPAQEG